MREIRLLGPGDEGRLDRFLAERGGQSQLLRANLERGGLEDRGAPHQGNYAAALREGAVTGLAVHLWNGMLLLQEGEAPEALARLALDSSGRALSGLLGPWEAVRRVGRALGLPADSSGLDRPQQLMTLHLSALVVPEPVSQGALLCRRARSSECELLYNWRSAMLAETWARPEDDVLREVARRGIDRWQGGGFNWVLSRGGCLVAYCGVREETDEAVQIGALYTPPDWRNRGYARALVAGVLAAAGERGRARALLFTASPAARRACEAIGFAAAGDVGLVLLEAA